MSSTSLESAKANGMCPDGPENGRIQAGRGVEWKVPRADMRQSPWQSPWAGICRRGSYHCRVDRNVGRVECCYPCKGEGDGKGRDGLTGVFGRSTANGLQGEESIGFYQGERVVWGGE